MSPGQALGKVPVFVLGLVPICAILFMLAYAFNAWWQEFEQSTADKLLHFDRLRSVASYRPLIEASGASQGQEAFKDLFLGEGTEAVVTAELLARLKQMASEQGIEVTRVDGLPLKTEGPLTLAGGGLEMSGTTPAILALIQKVEGARPLLFIDRLAIRSNGALEYDQRADTILTVEMQVYGAIRSAKAALLIGGD